MNHTATNIHLQGHLAWPMVHAAGADGRRGCGGGLELERLAWPRHRGNAGSQGGNQCCAAVAGQENSSPARSVPVITIQIEAGMCDQEE